MDIHKNARLSLRRREDLAGGPLKPGFGLSGDVHTSQT